MEKIRKEKSKDMKKTNINFMRQTLSLNKIKTTNGITLIALVITIIVLLILAGVTIATLTGENGILTRASEASEQTEIAEEEEAIRLAYSGVLADNNGSGVSASELQDELRNNGYNATVTDNGDGTFTVKFESGREYTINADGSISNEPGTGGGTGETPGNPDGEGYFTEDSTINGETGSKDNPTIPEGFRPVDTETSEWGDGTTAPEAEDINNGLVIEDKNLNQFVWVPVTYSDFQRYAGYSGGSLQSFSSSFGEANDSGNNTNAQITESSTTQTEAQNMYASVQRNGGFYVGRYEAGTTSERTGDSEITNDVVIKQGAYVYNYIGWSNSNGMTNDVGGAVELARNFDTENNYTSVTSTLIYGVQWDAIMQWIDPEYKDGNCASDSFVRNSTGKGNYDEDANTNPWKGEVTTTGASEEYAVNNVYDLAGNVVEWTMESYLTSSRVRRGCGYYGTGSDTPASLRDPNIPSLSNDEIGFRVTLFLNG